jgi:hypothetical protein
VNAPRYRVMPLAFLPADLSAASPRRVAVRVFLAIGQLELALLSPLEAFGSSRLN